MQISPAMASAFFDDFLRRQLGVFQQRARGGLRVRPAAADRDQAELGLDHVAVAGDDQRGLVIRHRQHRLEAAQDAVGAPVLGEFDRGAQQVALVLFQFRLEALEQREGIGRPAGEPGQDALVIQAPTLRALDLTTMLPSVTWPSPPRATLLPRRTDRMVVP